MTGWTVIEDVRHEQLLAASVPSPDIRVPLVTVEPGQRGQWVAVAAGAAVGRWLCWA